MLVAKVFVYPVPSVLLRNAFHCNQAMPKYKKLTENGKSKTKSEKNSTQGETVGSKAVYLGRNNEVMIKVLAKPNAKESLITGISEEAVEIQIGAPPSDGEANKELIQFLSSTLGLRKSDLSLEKGSRSREKTLIVSPSVSSVDSVLSKLKFASKTS